MLFLFIYDVLFSSAFTGFNELYLLFSNLIFILLLLISLGLVLFKLSFDISLIKFIEIFFDLGIN